MLDSSDADEHENWRKAKRSKAYGDCAELASSRSGIVIRDSKDREGPVLRYSAASWRTFVMVTKAGNFDGLR